jgi:RNA polymerase sigma factor (sigma-70 family)
MRELGTSHWVKEADVRANGDNVTPRRLIEPARLAGSTLLRTQSDARLVDLVRAGHAAAFEAIVQRYRRPLLAYCSRLLPDSRAEDAVQQTFVSAHQAMTRDEADLNLRPWLYRIARNASLNMLRQNGWAHDELDENFDGVERPDQALERREQLRSAVDAVKALPARQRDALVQRELEGKQYDEIAASMGVGDGAVRQLLHRARATLRAGASALTPVGLLERIAELGAGGGGIGAAKMGAALLATGAIAGGTLATPIARHHHPQPRVPAAAVPHRAKPKPKTRTVAKVAAPVRSAPLRQEVHRRHRSRHHDGSDNSGPGNARDTERLEQQHSGSGDSGKGQDNSGPGSARSSDDHSGSGSGGDSGSGGSGSGSGGSGSGGNDSGGGGSDDGH